jgi:glycosyltransferase involved in cell wall biosynthesis
MPELSVVIITFNEEKNIGRCLESVQEIADEIVVVDSFSTDRTQEICSRYKVKFIQHKFEGHIEQKNYAITQASYPHILSLDADEALDETAIIEVKKIKDNWEADGYEFNRLTSYCGKWIRHCGWYPDRKLRLWDSRKGMWKGVNPHDRFEMDSSTTTGRLKGDILHYSFYTIEGHVKQVNYFTDIAAEALYKQGKKTNLFHLTASPVFKFFRDYLFKLGFLDGYYGFVVCVISSYATFLKYAKLKSMYMERT